MLRELEMRVSYGWGTHPGRVRQINEDRVLAVPPVFLVADGMGGHARGDAASTIVVEEFNALAARRPLRPAQVMAALAVADQRVRDLEPSTSEPGGAPGTTAAAVIGLEQDGRDYWLVLNVGDSRVYRLEGGVLVQVSVDHSLVQELVDGGELRAAEARNHRDRNVITRAVGSPAGADPDCWLLPVTAPARFLVCSDGLSSVLDDDRLTSVLTTHDDPQDTVDALVAEVVQRGGRDDVSAVVVDVVDERSGEETTVPRRPQAVR